MEEKLNEYKLKMYQNFAYILCGNKSFLNIDADTEVFKHYITEIKEKINPSMFYFKAGIAVDTVLQDAIRYDAPDKYKISYKAMEQFIDEIGVGSE